jgi:HK97 family phage major capsid protein
MDLEKRHIQNIVEDDESYTITFGKSMPEIPIVEEEDQAEEDVVDKAVADIDFSPTEGMVTEAKKGLEWRKEFGRGGTAVGVARARTIVNRQNLTPSTVKRMYSYFSRHEVDKQGEGFTPDEKGFPSNGRIAWALWGGDAGYSWSRKKVDQIKNEEEKMEDRILLKHHDEDCKKCVDGECTEHTETKEKTSDLGLDTKEILTNDKLERTFHLKAKNVDQKNRTVKLAFSSEEPYPRDFGLEVLSHNQKDADLSFLQSGQAPLLLDHDSTKQIGVIEKAEISESDKVGRAIVRFGKSQLADEVFRDVVDSIRQNISVGYEITKMTKDKYDEDNEDYGKSDYFRVNWKPLEISSVSIPADTTVGVGRSRNNNNNNNKKENVMSDDIKITNNEVEAPKVDVKAVTEEARKEEMSRIREIEALGGSHNVRDKANEAIKNGLSIAEFRGVVLDHIGTSKPLTTDNEVGLSKKDNQEYSIAKAIKAMASNDWSNAGLEKEASDEIAQRTGKSPRGFFVPSDLRWQQRDLIAGTAADGGNLVATDFQAGSFIEALRAKMVVKQAGALVLSGLVGPVAIPAQNAVTTGSWVAENAAVSEVNTTYRQVTMSAKTVGAFTDLSRHLMHQSTPNIETIIRNDIIKTLSNEVDAKAIQGTGTSNTPTGILNTSGIGSVAGGTNGAAVSYANVVNTWAEVAKDNADNGALAWITSPTQVARNIVKPKVASTDSVMIQNTFDELLGYKVYSTSNSPDNLTKGTASGTCSSLIFGNKDLIA